MNIRQLLVLLILLSMFICFLNSCSSARVHGVSEYKIKTLISNFKKPYLFEKTVNKLVDIGRPAVPYLIAALRDNNPKIRSAAAAVLEKIGDERAVKSLAAALMDEDRLVRYRSARALGEIGDERAVEPLIAALKDKTMLIDGIS